jgi:hypothetical protein
MKAYNIPGFPPLKEGLTKAWWWSGVPRHWNNSHNQVSEEISKKISFFGCREYNQDHAPLREVQHLI